jgi:hypothetical protein
VSGYINNHAGGFISRSLTIYQEVNIPHSTNPVFYSCCLCKLLLTVDSALRVPLVVADCRWRRRSPDMECSYGLMLNKQSWTPD